MAIKCTVPAGKFMASAELGETVMLCSCLFDIIVFMPPQATMARENARMTRETIKREGLRIVTSKSGQEGQEIAPEPEGPSHNATPVMARKKPASAFFYDEQTI